MNYYKYSTSIGNIFIYAQNECITAISVSHSLKQECEYAESPITIQCINEINEYLKGERKIFTVPIKIKGTDFQNAVWNELRKIPYGEVRSYTQIAHAIGKTKAMRAVGNANHNNPILIIIPCHRVIGSDGKLTGFAAGIEMKRRLLEIEKHIL